MLRGFLFKYLLQLIKMKLVFHIMLDIITKTNCQRSNQPLSIQMSFYFWNKLLYVFLETNKSKMWVTIEIYQKYKLKRGVEFVWTSQNQEFKLYHMHNCFKSFSVNGQ